MFALRFSRLMAAFAALLVAAAAPACRAQKAPLGAAVDPGAAQGVAPAANTTATNGGAAANADFDSLIDLITSTIDHDSWMENGTGEGEIQPFPNGVYVDAGRALTLARASAGSSLAGVRTRGAKKSVAARRPQANGETSQKPLWTRHSDLRFVSLPRLEAAIAASQAAHEPLSPDVLTLAGLQRISYVLVYPETHDLVLAGPAGDWVAAPGGRIVSAETGQPVMRLDDLLTLLRREASNKSPAFGCSIVPRQAALANAQAYLTASATQSLEPSQRRAWLEGLRQSVGVQDVEYYNIDADTRIARVLLEADYHMKLVGMGLAKGIPGVKSYLATVRLDENGAPPPMAVLRWWFSMPKSTVEASAEHDAFVMPTQCVEVLSENEMLAARGERVHTGQSDDLNRQFADSFTAQYEALSEKYPVYGELSRVFETSLALAVIKREGLAEKAGWKPRLLASGDQLRLPRTPAPKAVETVINHRVIGGRQIVAGVSGGVWVDGGRSAEVATASGKSAAALATVRGRETPQANRAAKEPGLVWWWD